ncbi:MAG TPA: ABC transporter [Clostridiales bacterium UBA8960]|nr:ABC transporter [Clostridiales bacterium UBA8960]
MHLLTVEALTKSYSMTKLFDQIHFSIDSSDKIGLIGINGTGKSTLLKIIVGKEQPDHGQIMSIKNIKINYLEQEQNFIGTQTVLEQIFSTSSESMTIIRDYEKASHDLELNPLDASLQSKFNRLSEEMTAKQLFDLEYQIKGILNALGIDNLDATVDTLSGGQKKRLALAEALVSPCDLLVLDEPTNHLDSKTIIWLEEYLKMRQGALLMITHDRYFLDRIVNKTIELTRGKLFEYTGNYEYYIEKKSERLALESSMQQKRQNLYKRELAWMRAGVQARGTKAKSRIQRFKLLEDQIKTESDGEIEIEVGYRRLGNKVIELKKLGMSFVDKRLFHDFEYFFTGDDRIGIVGDNGVGKSTLMNLISGHLTPTEGVIDIGSTVKFGYFTQDFDGFDNLDQRAIDYIKEIAEYVQTPSGYKISASELMETFLFTSELQWTPIGKLSGGEKRRLQLLSVLIDSPNVLLLDEPTNNLDLDTLKVFESYLDAFKGVIICVSHDRYFLDRICDKLFAFEEGVIVQKIISYSEYLEEMMQSPLKSEKKIEREPYVKQTPKLKKEKLTFKEIKALEMLPEEISQLSEALDKIEQSFAEYATDFSKLTELGEKKESLEMALLEKMELLELLQEKAAGLLE